MHRRLQRGLARFSARRGHVWVDEQPLIFFHFAGFQQINRWLYEPNLINFGTFPTKLIRRHLLLPYWDVLQEKTRQVYPDALHPLAPPGLRAKNRHDHTGSFPQKTWLRLRRWWRLCRGLLRRRYLVAWRG